ncbi:unnamed protein product [Cunninghamella echinulata]
MNLSHSLILDVSDNYWKDVFISEETIETNGDQHGKPLARDLWDDVQKFLNDIKNTENASEALRLVKNKDINIEQEPNLLWIYKAIIDSAWKFIRSSPLHSFTERDVLYRLYGVLLDFYYNSDIEAIGSDLSSNSNSYYSNQGQNLDEIEGIERKESDPIVDAIYTSG